MMNIVKRCNVILMIQKIQRLMFIFLVTLSGLVVASETDEDVRLRQEHQAPEELARLLDEAYEHDQDFRTCINASDDDLCRCPHDMACYIKKYYAFERLKGWENAHQIINDENLNEIVLPQKYLWRDFLVAEKLSPESGTLDGITKDQLVQLIALARAGGFSDFVGGKRMYTNNVFFTKDYPGKQFWKPDSTPAEAHERKIAIIDTKYFYFSSYVPEEHNIWRLFSRWKSDQCNDGSMRIANDVDVHYIPNDFESFWQKYHECFQARNHEQS